PLRAKIAAARADKRPGISSAQLRQQLQGRYQELRNEL
ncbi:TPA: plasmid stabilization protein, partial [Escherichia coli]